MGVQTFRPELAVQGFDERVIRGFFGPAEVEYDAASIGPQIKILRDELRAVVQSQQPIEIKVFGQFIRCGKEVRLVIGQEDAKVDSRLLREIIQARQWLDDLANGRAASLAELARSSGVSAPYMGSDLFCVSSPNRDPATFSTSYRIYLVNLDWWATDPVFLSVTVNDSVGTAGAMPSEAKPVVTPSPGPLTIARASQDRPMRE